MRVRGRHRAGRPPEAGFAWYYRIQPSMTLEPMLIRLWPGEQACVAGNHSSRLRATG
ncbi:hypothetical protein SBA1_410013 [Candidatus Sulfotelmatobacter kueseliae]|uniref:Uncharacterized protein n=1 Tax=Candidatus Sulfotelmatobacter kueseliae TaxID=2042962 RepID=A0A2U3KQV9_9BACT|nr:hypothetical protein SBA1_410013 [Candidatus Sulfotelmatobacter kueseliae]